MLTLCRAHTINKKVFGGYNKATMVILGMKLRGGSATYDKDLSDRHTVVVHSNTIGDSTQCHKKLVVFTTSDCCWFISQAQSHSLTSRQLTVSYCQPLKRLAEDTAYWTTTITLLNVDAMNETSATLSTLKLRQFCVTVIRAC